MKTKTIIEEITHEELVDLISTATYGNQWCEIFRNKEVSGDVEPDDGDCREDVWANVLLVGHSLYFADYNASNENEFYGDLPHEWDEEGQCINYTFNLNDVKQGLSLAASSNHNYVRECFENFRAENMDLNDAGILFQFIIFGEHIYG